ncbi:MAG: radical SAM protein [Candidatus Omnitrophota bacterium]
MKKVLLLSPPYLKYYMRNARCDFVSLSKTQWYPIWLGYCGAFLEKHGYKVRLIDAPSYRLSYRECENMAIEYEPDLLVVYSSTQSEDKDIEFVEKLVDKMHCRAVFVGPYVSISPEMVLKKTKRIDLAIKGEFEYPVFELLKGTDYNQIKNLYYKIDEDIRHNESRPLLDTKELDGIPFVTDFFKRHLNFKYYKTPSEYYPFIDLMTGRGCEWGRCTFCLWVHSFIPGPVYNCRSISNVIGEFKFVETKMPRIRSIMVQDDTLTSERARELSEQLLENNIKIPWSCYARPDMELDVLNLMKKAGCRNLHVGYESANLEVLKNIRKGITKDRMTRFNEDVKKSGLRIHADFAIGLEGETREGVFETIKWAKELDPETAQFQLIIPYPSTPLYDSLKEKRFLSGNIPDYPGLSKEEMKSLAKRAYREFYLSGRYLKKAIMNPYERIFTRIDTILSALNSIFFSKEIFGLFNIRMWFIRAWVIFSYIMFYIVFFKDFKNY